MRTTTVVSAAFACCLLFFTFLPATASVSSSTTPDNEQLGLDVRVLALDGVAASDVDNISRVIEGVYDAVRLLNSTGFWYRGTPDAFEKQNVSVVANYRVITNWQSYKGLMESGSGFVIVNAHGETVPVPAMYSAGSWVDVIAEAMLHRNVTWVHMAGYPFSRYAREGQSIEPWGEDGFKRLMSHIGRPNATAWPTHNSENEKVLITTDAAVCLDNINKWSPRLFAGCVSIGRPISSLEFEKLLVLQLYEDYGDCCVGGVVAFAEHEDDAVHGFYVHLGANETFSAYVNATDRDYSRGYVGTAAAIWAIFEKRVSEAKLQEAQHAIDLAKADGRIRGIIEAGDLLEEAKACFAAHRYWSAMETAFLAAEAANNAVQLDWYEKNAVALTLIGVAIACLVGGVWKMRVDKNRDEEPDEERSSAISS